MDVEDPDPKNKRDVIVTFFNVDDFCDALVKNGRSILSYNFDVCYDPFVLIGLVIHRNLHRKGTTHSRGGRGGRGGRDGRDNYSRRNSHRDDEGRREQSGDVRNQDYEERRNYRSHNDGNRGGYKSGRYNNYQHRDDNNFHIDTRGIILHQKSGGVGRRVEGKEQNVVVKSTNRFGAYSDSDD